MEKDTKQPYRFWRWLILTILRFPKLYTLVWGIIILFAIICIKIDLSGIISRIL